MINKLGSTQEYRSLIEEYKKTLHIEPSAELTGDEDSSNEYPF